MFSAGFTGSSRVLWVGVLMLVAGGVFARAQDDSGWRKKLLERPLYLRGFWTENTLEFDAAGQPLKVAHPGPLTLSGIDVRSVSVKGTKMVISGNRIGLVAVAGGRLERRLITSTTLILPSLLKDKEFKAAEEMKLTVHADASGNFDAPLKAIFADGLAEFSTSVPEYWRCYANGYFAKEMSDTDATETTDACLRERGMDTEVRGGGEFSQTRIVSPSPMHAPSQAYELGVHGECVARLLISKEGVPVLLQIVRPVGAGLDEEVLQALSRYRFKPATLDGSAVRSAFDFTMTIGRRN
jgi:hypothetical protein